MVIGNPPYIRIQALKEWAPLEVEFYKKRYVSASKGNYDIYVVFVEKGLNLLNSRGRLGFILPHKFFNTQYGEGLRGLISNGKHLAEVIHFGDKQIFAGATTYTCLMFLEKAGAEQCIFTKIDDLHEWQKSKHTNGGSILTTRITSNEWDFSVGKEAVLFDKLGHMPTRLGDIAEKIYQGLITGADSVFILDNKGRRRYFSEETQREHTIEAELMRPLCKGSINIRRYCVSDIKKYILFPYLLVQRKATLISPEEFKKKYPFAWEYLTINKHKLESREHGKWKNDRWYAFGRSQNLSEMEINKILTPSIAKKASFSLDKGEFYYFVGSGGGGGGGYGITLKEEVDLKYEYILGLLNSRLLDTYLKSFSSHFSGGFYAYNRQYIERLPVCKIDFTNHDEKLRHDRIVQLVEQMLSLHKKLNEAKTGHEKTALQRQIDATDRQIDQLVYELYGLTEEEIRIVEESRP